jgi:hypothetical protein
MYEYICVYKYMYMYICISSFHPLINTILASCCCCFFCTVCSLSHEYIYDIYTWYVYIYISGLKFKHKFVLVLLLLQQSIPMMQRIVHDYCLVVLSELLWMDFLKNFVMNSLMWTTKNKWRMLLLLM